MNKIVIYDTTLRDGAQGEGVSFSSAGKIRIAKQLDLLGVDYIEGGFAASNPRDMEFFNEIRKEKLTHAKIAAFGSTRRAHVPVGEDAGVRALLEAKTSVCTFFGKSWRLHVTDVLKVPEKEALAMIADTVRVLKEHGKEVVFDAEHFFDGYKDSPEFARAALTAALNAGADCLCLCDTNGGTLPHEIASITAQVVRDFPVRIGIHVHNDGDCAVANSLEAVRAGATQVQGTMNGYGERCGNANLCSIIPGLVLKLGHKCLHEGSLKKLREAALFVDEMANLRPNRKAPYVGESAFAHKAGMHVDAVRKNPTTFEHVLPESVGNQRRILVSELSGASNVVLKVVEMGLALDKGSPEIKEILRELERMEQHGYAFEAAEGSFKLLIQKVLKKHKPFFELQGFRVIVEKRTKDSPCISEATVKVAVGGETALTVGEGNGPVDALDRALRKALVHFYPQIKDVSLTDYRVRILDPTEATAAKTRVVIESSDGANTWGTVGVSPNIIEASWEALVDSVEYKLLESEKSAKKKT